MRFAVMTQQHQAPFGLVLAQLHRMLAAATAVLPPPDRAPPPHDPVFLPDFTTLTPDQAQEMRYGKGRDQ
jgi:hypothetical protein